MAPRANWKGWLKVGEVTCPVALYTAVSTSDRISFHMVNRETGHRLSRQFVDSETGKVVDRDDQVKGYEIDKDRYVILEPEDIAAAVPESDKTLDVIAFLECDGIDKVYFDRPYFLGPSGAAADEPYALLRDAMRKAGVAAIARTVLFRRVRTVLVRPHAQGMIATTLNFDYEVRSAEEAFRDIRKMRIQVEMLELAQHIIATKRGHHDPAAFEDRYEEALAELVKAKLEGRKIRRRKAPPSTKPSDLLDALRRSADGETKPEAKRRTPAKGTAAKAPATAKRRKKAA